MMSLSRRIEEYIKHLLKKQPTIEVQRSELADFFSCVPSQINYVLSTRFTPVQGYIVESRRGGGGYVRIIKLSWEDDPHQKVKQIFHNLGMELDQGQAEGMLNRLKFEEFITPREYHILKAIISRETLQMDLPQRDILRVKIIQAALAALSRDDL